eukprot:GFUD01019320.1.p1 GENE.GFUD01019320.1~~GFUD01019320.1.p1  ORF type:complete len:296 (+),score=97.95 GFUD01019320.1:72-890(+)
MGGTHSREVTITDEKSQAESEGGMTKSSTLPATFRGLGDWAGTLPKGLSFESKESLGKRLRKSFNKFDVTPSKDATEKGTEVIAEDVEEDNAAKEIVESVEEDNAAKEIVESVEEDNASKEIVESLLVEVIEEATEGISELETSKSSTLPSNFRLGLNRTQSFGKRIRKSVRKLVTRTPKKNKNRKENIEIIKALISDVLSEVTGVVDGDEEIENLEEAEMSLKALELKDQEQKKSEENELVEKTSAVDVPEEPVKDTAAENDTVVAVTDES